MRTLDILEFLFKSNSPLKTNEISDIVRVPRTTTYRILRTLVHRGYVSQDLEGGFSFQHSDNPKIIPIRPQDQYIASHGKGEFEPDLPADEVIEMVIALLQGLRRGKEKQALRAGPLDQGDGGLRIQS
jgi:predicted ArsR family transcriptional regulator